MPADQEQSFSVFTFAGLASDVVYARHIKIAAMAQAEIR